MGVGVVALDDVLGGSGAGCFDDDVAGAAVNVDFYAVFVVHSMFLVRS